jgi:hypothetical protein
MSIPAGHEEELEESFSILARALHVYHLHSIVVQESGFASGGYGRMWADQRVRNDLSSRITLVVGSNADEIKRSVYMRDARPWYSSVWRMDSSGARSWEWDFDARPRYSGPLSNCLETYLEDLAAFPRADHLVPLWMRPTLAAAGASGAPAVMDEPEFWYLLPIRDSPTGPRRAFCHRASTRPTPACR